MRIVHWCIVSAIVGLTVLGVVNGTRPQPDVQLSHYIVWAIGVLAAGGAGFNFGRLVGMKNGS